MDNSITDEEEKDERQLEDLIPRNYQQDMLQAVINGNSIIYLPTGAGKTFIAFMAMKHFYSQIDKPLAAGGKRIVFAAPKVALVTQQCQVLERQTQFSVGMFNGNMNVDNWSRDMWEQQIRSHQVLVMGSQILLDILDKGFLKMRQICLLVLDECHHATESHNMKLIMENHYIRNDPCMSRILGLTATLVKKNVPKFKLQEAVKCLEQNLCSKIVTHFNDEDLKGLYANPRIQILSVKGIDAENDDNLSVVLGVLKDTPFLKEKASKLKQSPNGAIRQQFRDLGEMVTKKNPVLSDCLKTILDIEHHLIDMGLFGGKLAVKFHITRFKVLRQSLSVNSLEYRLLNEMLDHLTEVTVILEQLMTNAKGNYMQMCCFSSTKIHTLFDVLRTELMHSFKNGEATLCGIVFVQRRVTAVVLYHMLKIAMEADKSISALRPDFALGGSGTQSYGTMEYALKNEKMKRSIDRFNARVTNLVFSTDVLEEGIDVPRCNIVIRFDQIKTMCSFIQSKGRARDQSAKFFVLDVDNDFLNKCNAYKEMEKLLKEVHSWDEKEPNPNEIKKLDPLKTLAGSLATVDNSIKLVFRYCNSLSNGRFACSEPNWFFTEQSPQGPFTFSVVLPASSPYKKPIKGTEMSSMKEAKSACALEAVKLLYSIGELDHYLRPNAKSDQSTEMDNKELFKHWKKSDTEDETLPDAGTKGRRRNHKIHYPATLRNIAPTAMKEVFMHIINFEPKFDRPPEANSRRSFFYDLMRSQNQGFALLTSKSWPELCKFPIFTNFGEMIVEVLPNSSTLELDEVGLLKIQQFNKTLFENLLDIQHSFLVTDYESGFANMLLVPTKPQVPTGKAVLDWSAIFSEIHTDMECEDLLQMYGVQGLLGKVVNPKHRKGPIDKANWNYIVTRVRDDLNPLSNFPNNKSKNYADFYKSNYGAHVTNMSQPLLEVRPISDKMGMLLQGKDNSQSKIRTKEREGEIFIPELCSSPAINSVLSSELWVKATTLPTVIARICWLLTADELRRKINADTKLGSQELPKGSDWEPFLVSTFSDKYTHLNNKRIQFSNKTRKAAKSTSAQIEDRPLDLEYNLLSITDEDIKNYAKFVAKRLETTLPKSEGNYKLRDSSIVVKPICCFSKRGVGHLGPELHNMYRALTTTIANDAVDMERLEILGDSFLKYTSSLYLYETYDFSEGKMTQLKGKIVGNKNLFYCAMNKNMAGFLHAARFSPKLEWKAPNYKVPDVVSKVIMEKKLDLVALKNITSIESGGLPTPQNWPSLECTNKEDLKLNLFFDLQDISDKCVADSVEALIGSYVESCGPVDSAALLTWFEILPPAIQTLMTSHSVLHCANPDIPHHMLQAQVNEHLTQVNKLEQVLGYKFKDRAFLLEALTHSSCMSNRITGCNQRLEFLGDAVLDFLITCYIYEYCGNLSPGAVTDLRSALVNNIIFGSLTVRYGLHSFLLHNSSSLFQIIDAFVEYQQNNDHAISEEYLLALNDDSCLNAVASYIEVPKALGDIWESIAGAVYLDSGKDLSATWAVFYPLMKKEIDLFSSKVPIQPVRKLYESCGKENSLFEVVEREEKNSHDILMKLTVKAGGEEVVCYGQGRNKQQAKIACSKYALKRLGM